MQLTKNKVVITNFKVNLKYNNMKKVIFAVLGGLLIALAVVSCTNDTSDENIYEQSIDKDKVVPPGEKDTD